MNNFAQKSSQNRSLAGILLVPNEFRHGQFRKLGLMGQCAEEYMEGKSKESPEGVRQQLKPGDVRVVNINGRPTTLVIGRAYEFKLKPGCAPQPNEGTTKGAASEPKKKTPKTKAKTGKLKPAAE
jgi:hypothetical protein